MINDKSLIRLYLVLSVIFGMVSLDAAATPRIFECKGARISVDLPNYIELSRADNDSCVFWRNRNVPDYSGYYFEGMLSLNDHGVREPYHFQSSSDPSEGTWDRLLNKGVILVLDNKDSYIRIDQANYRSKFLAHLSNADAVEKISNITRIEGEVLDKGVWVRLSFAIPYKTLTEDSVIRIIKSVEVIRAFDAATSGTDRLNDGQ